MISWTHEKLRKKLRSQHHYLFWRVADVLRADAAEILGAADIAGV